ncbi:hypothetical protein BC936DRAFT_139043 [Jimgerdemannia flammicorona]|uniref:Uncharacterized protein n=1 Tax=Jimgerdemannia flammicorona TaxID=994334 RepID=A0A433BAS0_9FUNG|nr:hypothetical protein BC936DRAFT_139043 [Jimgerdemannia flammicorona]
MNSTAASNLPIASDNYGSIVLAWFGVVFSLLCTVVIGRKTIIDYNRLRLVCFFMGIIVWSLNLANALRIYSAIDEDLYGQMRNVNLVLYLDLMVVITFDVGGKFYPFGDRINTMWWIATLSTLAVNLVYVVIITLVQIPSTYPIGNSINSVVRIIWPISVFFAYLYAFYPIIKMKTGVGESPSAVVALGVWYLTGTGLCLLLHIITMLVIIPFPLPKYKALNVAGTGIATSFRALLLVFYSTPPSNDIILRIRRMFFPSSFRGSKVNDVNSSARSEMQQNPGIQLPDVQSTADSINNAEVTAV